MRLRLLDQASRRFGLCVVSFAVSRPSATHKEPENSVCCSIVVLVLQQATSDLSPDHTPVQPASKAATVKLLKSSAGRRA